MLGTDGGPLRPALPQHGQQGISPDTLGAGTSPVPPTWLAAKPVVNLGTQDSCRRTSAAASAPAPAAAPCSTTTKCSSLGRTISEGTRTCEAHYVMVMNIGLGLG